MYAIRSYYENLVEKFEDAPIDVDGLNSGLGGTLSDWGLVGDATEFGWDTPDIHMYETANNQYSVYAKLSAGSMKFRLDEMWAVNYGDTSADGTLEQDGA